MVSNHHHDVEADPLFPRVCAAANSLRRLDRRGHRRDADDRSIRHRGAERTGLATWEDDERVIQRQVLTFLGLAVEYRRGRGLRTGTAKEDPGDHGTAAAGRIRYDSSPSLRVVELSARLLREARRDYYTQHLLQQINDALTTRFNRPQTQVYGLMRWRDRLRRASVGLRRMRRGRRQIVVYLVIGAFVGAAVTAVILAVV